MNIADALVRDLLTERPRSPEAKTCFACGRPHSRGDGRFCGRKCRRAYDLGFTPGEVVSKPRDGVSLPCRGCGRQFVSRGLLWIGGVVFVRHGILLALVPPAFVLALGSALVWASKGFRE